MVTRFVYPQPCMILIISDHIRDSGWHLVAMILCALDCLVDVWELEGHVVDSRTSISQKPSQEVGVIISVVVGVCVCVCVCVCGVCCECVCCVLKQRCLPILWNELHEFKFSTVRKCPLCIVKVRRNPGVEPLTAQLPFHKWHCTIVRCMTCMSFLNDSRASTRE